MTDLSLIGLVGACISLLTGSLTLFLLVSHKRKEHQQIIVPLQEAVLQSQLEIQEKAFNDISNEIYNNIGQMLSLAKLNLNTLDTGLPETTEEKIRYSKELVGQAIIDLRQASKSLNPKWVTETGIRNAIQHELELISRAGQYKTDLLLNGEPFKFDRQKELVIFRIFQELLNNIIKHANAKTVFVRLLYQPRLFNLTVSDDGDGFEMSAYQPHKPSPGLGISNMQNRATLIGGSFQLSSTLGKGTTVSVNLPLENNNGTV
jgi:two-component system, NarL family, sensor kinase